MIIFISGNLMAGTFLDGDLLAHAVTFGDFKAGNFLAGDFLADTTRYNQRKGSPYNQTKTICLYLIN